MVFPELCHGCGACSLCCEEGALTEVGREVGTLRRGTRGNIAFWSAVLDVCEARASSLIQALLQAVATVPRQQDHLTILDAPPGTSCSAMTAVHGADLVVLVTEPTPFGLHDLDLAVQMCRALAKPVVAVVNRSDLGSLEVLRWIETQSIPLWGEIPFSREVAAAYAAGEFAATRCSGFRRSLEDVVRALDRMSA